MLHTAALTQGTGLVRTEKSSYLLHPDPFQILHNGSAQRLPNACVSYLHPSRRTAEQLIILFPYLRQRGPAGCCR